MKLKYFASAIMVMALAGCSNEDVLVDNNIENEIKNGESAYLSINLRAADNLGSRGDVGSPEFLEANPELEGTVKTVGFYFFNATGDVVAPNGANAQGGWFNALADSSTGLNFNDDNTSEDNLESTSDITLQFQNWSTNTTPTQVLVVLNLDKTTFDNLVKGTTGTAKVNALANLQNGVTGYLKELSSEADNTKENYFIMSNSVYFDANGTKIDATPIKLSDFKESDTAANANPVDIYVERMAVKVEVTTDKKYSSEITIPEGNSTYDEITIDLIGWGLNAVNKDAYLVKHFNDNWNVNTFNWTWNASTLFRSYWAYDNDYESANINYPDSYKQDKDGEVNYTSEENWPLEYYSWNELAPEPAEGETTATSNVAAKYYKYCQENTFNDDTKSNGKTHVILLAKLKVDGEEVGENKYVYRPNTGALYDEENYINYGLMQIAGDYSSYYVGTQVDDAIKYENLTSNDVEIKYLYDGYVALQIKSESITDKKIYKKETAEEYSPVESDDEVLALNKVLRESTEAQAYNNGRMYYDIPIEHLATEGEGQYGVVRNHWYKLTINKIGNLGKAVYDPDEDIVPNKPEDFEYFLSTRINVLSWHIVDQSVDL